MLYPFLNLHISASDDCKQEIGCLVKQAGEVHTSLVQVDKLTFSGPSSQFFEPGMPRQLAKARKVNQVRLCPTSLENRDAYGSHPQHI